MKTSTWIVLIIIGAVLMVIGLSIAWRVEMRNIGFGIEVPTTPYFMPGVALAGIGGLLITISILGFIIGYQKEAAKEIISEGIRKWKEPSPPSQTVANVKYCPKCGASMSKESTYCPKCGQKQSEM